MWNVTAEGADFWFSIFSWLLVAAAICVGVATYGVTVMGSAKEHFSSERIAANEAETKRAIADSDNAREGAAKANEAAAFANERAASAELELEKIKQQARPRQLNGALLVEALEGKPKAPVEILFPRDDSEAFALAMQIRDFLKLAHWEVLEPSAISSEHIAPRLSRYPTVMGAGGQPSGVSVVARPLTPDDFSREEGDVPDTPFKSLKNALLKSLGQLSSTESLGEGPPAGILRIVVGPKPALAN
jgi:hypothetical protein